MLVLSYIVLFVLPILAFLALARAMDEHAPWSILRVVIFNAMLFGIGAAILAFIDGT